MNARSREEMKKVEKFFADKARRMKHALAEEGKSFGGCEHGTDIRSVECPECLEEMNEHRRVAESPEVHGESRSAGKGAHAASRSRRGTRGKARSRSSA